MTYANSILRHALLLGVLACSACNDDAGDDEATSNAGESDTGTDSSESVGESESSETGTTDSTETGTTDSTDTDTESTDTDSTDTDSTDTDSTDTTDTTTDGEPIMCPGVFPSFDKTCSTADDCVLVQHTTDCCGNSELWGINAAELSAFEAAEAICVSQYPACDCPAGPPVAEDGNAVGDIAEAAVDCIAGSCSSYVP